MQNVEFGAQLRPVGVFGAKTACSAPQAKGGGAAAEAEPVPTPASKAITIADTASRI